MTPKTILTALALLLCTAASANADQNSGPDPIGAVLIPPDVVMNHQHELGLSDTQRDAIRTDAQNAQQRFMSTQWQLSAATEKLADILKADHVDEAKALAQLNAVLDLERQMKRTQLTLMIEVKNELTPQQQAAARQFAPAGAR